MTQILNTSATNYFLEDLIKRTSERLILISPYLRLNTRIKELLGDKNRLKIDVRLVYGKNEIQPGEIDWLKDLPYIRTSFCKNLHAKCYLNEDTCIITSMNLYEFSQVNNNEMGVLIKKSETPQLYKDAYDEAQRLIRVSEEARVSVDRILTLDVQLDHDNEGNKEPTSKLARRHKMTTERCIETLISLGYLNGDLDRQTLTEAGLAVGAELITKSRFGPYFLWPTDLNIK